MCSTEHKYIFVSTNCNLNVFGPTRDVTNQVEGFYKFARWTMESKLDIGTLTFNLTLLFTELMKIPLWVIVGNVVL